MVTDSEFMLSSEHWTSQNKMKPFSMLSRKPLLALAFVAAFVLLYNVASHPRVTKTMQPQAYYDNYDARVCLPQQWLKSHPPREKAKAAFVILVRNRFGSSLLYYFKNRYNDLIYFDREQEDIAGTIVNLEDRFNKNFRYPYVFLNNEPFTEEFKSAMHRAAPGAIMQFGLVPVEHWSYPASVNQTRAAECREEMRAKNVMFGDMESYHHMCRYQSGFFFRHPLLDK